MNVESGSKPPRQEKSETSEKVSELPESVLPLNFLEQLHEPEEIVQLIKERHGLNKGDLFLHTADSGTSMDIFDRNTLLKFALMRLECVDYKTISNFFNYEIDRSKDKNSLQTTWAGRAGISMDCYGKKLKIILSQSTLSTQGIFMILIYKNQPTNSCVM